MFPPSNSEFFAAIMAHFQAKNPPCNWSQCRSRCPNRNRWSIIREQSKEYVRHGALLRLRCVPIPESKNVRKFCSICVSTWIISHRCQYHIFSETLTIILTDKRNHFDERMKDQSASVAFGNRNDWSEVFLQWFNFSSNWLLNSNKNSDNALNYVNNVV